MGLRTCDCPQDNAIDIKRGSDAKRRCQIDLNKWKVTMLFYLFWERRVCQLFNKIALVWLLESKIVLFIDSASIIISSRTWKLQVVHITPEQSWNMGAWTRLEHDGWIPGWITHGEGSRQTWEVVYLISEVCFWAAAYFCGGAMEWIWPSVSSHAP